MTAWRWLTANAVLAIHEQQLAEHGGGIGVRDFTLLDAALAKPQQLEAYSDPSPDLCALAAALAHGLARLHPFVDGNKRTSLVATELFIRMQRHRLTATDAQCVEQWLLLASGDLDAAALADWLRIHVRIAQ